MTLVDHVLSIYKALALKRNHSVIPIRFKQGWRDGSAEDLSLVLSINMVTHNPLTYAGPAYI